MVESCEIKASPASSIVPTFSSVYNFSNDTIEDGCSDCSWYSHRRCTRCRADGSVEYLSQLSRY